MKTSAGLRAAAEHIEKHGWHQGGLRWQGRVCMIGACVETGVDSNVSLYGDAPSLYLDRWFTENLGPSGSGLRPTAYWNDHPETTKEDALLWMKRAAADAEAEGK